MLDEYNEKWRNDLSRHIMLIELVRMVVAFSSPARILGEGSSIHSLPALFKNFFSEDQLTHTNSIHQARISPQWLSELRSLWLSVSL